jgi:hypothetical protein
MQFCGIVFWPCDGSGCCSIIAAITEAPSGKHAGGAGYSVAEGGTQRADSNAPIAKQCQWFLSNLVALSVPPLDDSIPVSEGAPRRTIHGFF